MSEIEQRYCPDCGKKMDIIISVTRADSYVCSNMACTTHDPFNKEISDDRNETVRNQ